MTLRLTHYNRQAKPIGYHKQKPMGSTFSSRYMLLSGLVVLSFVAYHLAHLTFRWTHKEFALLGDFDVYQMMVLSFKSPYVAGFYIVSICLLMMHLNHGVASLFQTLGLNHVKYNKLLKGFGPFLSISLAIGFISIRLVLHLLNFLMPVYS